MSFEEIKNGSSSYTEEHASLNTEIYDEDGDLLPHFASEVFCHMEREKLIELDPGVLADVILDSRYVFIKSTEIQYVAENLLCACLKALMKKDETLTRMFRNLTDNGTRNMNPEEMSELLQGFVFSKSEEINLLMSLDKVLR